MQPQAVAQSEQSSKVESLKDHERGAGKHLSEEGCKLGYEYIRRQICICTSIYAFAREPEHYNP